MSISANEFAVEVGELLATLGQDGTRAEHSGMCLHCLLHLKAQGGCGDLAGRVADLHAVHQDKRGWSVGREVGGRLAPCPGWQWMPRRQSG